MSGSTDDSDPCPICGAAARLYCTKHAHQQEWRIARCRECGHGFVVNRPTPQQLKPIYEQWEVDRTVGATADSMQNHADAADLAGRIATLTRTRGKALDVGSGGGAFSFHLAKHGFAPLMIDWDQRQASLTAIVPNSTFRSCGIEDVSPQDGPFDAILMSQVLEHAVDPLDWMRRARSLLVPAGSGSNSGLLAIALPNFGGVYHLLGARDPFLIPPMHLNYFTARSMRLALEKTGFHVESIASRSRMTLAPPGRTPRGWRVLAKRGWNVMSPLLNPTPWGIVLWAFGRAR